jgi:hypothetical protein
MRLDHCVKILDQQYPRWSEGHMPVPVDLWQSSVIVSQNYSSESISDMTGGATGG